LGNSDYAFVLFHSLIGEDNEKQPQPKHLCYRAPRGGGTGNASRMLNRRSTSPGMIQDGLLAGKTSSELFSSD
jgi:hypothetical protein